MLVAAFILSLILFSIFFTLNTAEFSNSVSAAKVDLQSKVRRLMDWVVKDVRQTNTIEINSNNPAADHIKFKQVLGVNNVTGSYLLSSEYVEYDYNATRQELARRRLDNNSTVLAIWVYDNITASPFYTAPGVPLVSGAILSSKKLVILLSGRSQPRNSVVLNFTLSEEVKIRNE